MAPRNGKMWMAGSRGGRGGEMAFPSVARAAPVGFKLLPVEFRLERSSSGPRVSTKAFPKSRLDLRVGSKVFPGRRRRISPLLL